MFGQRFYHGTIRKYVTYFGTLFNDVWIQRDVDDIIQDLKVPLTYGPKDKVLARALAAPDLTNQQVAVTLPRMAFEMLTMSYDGTRKLNTINRNVSQSTDSGKLKYQYNPVPFNFTFSLYVMVKNAEDGTKILEQILPYFTPEWTSTLNLIPEMDIAMDVPVVLMNVTTDDRYEGDFTTRRVLTHTLDFMVKGYVFGPVKSSKIITLANVNFFDASGGDTIEDVIGNANLVPENVTITPGLLANGSPTTNASLTIDRSDISANSNYGYIVQKS
jgi:T4-like virus Myoviridae tail sheath stabiliser